MGTEKSHLPLLVVLHGFPDSAFSLMPTIERLKNKFRIIAPFMPGTLNGEKVHHQKLGGKNIMMSLIELIQFHQLNSNQDIYLLGHDLGCFASVNLSFRFRHQIKGMIHINGLGLQQFYSRKTSIIQWIKSSYVLTAQFAIVRGFVSRITPEFFFRLILRLGKVPTTHELHKREAKLLSPIAIYRTLFKTMTSFVKREPLKIKTPTLFLWGNKDRFLNIPSLDEVERFYTDCEVRIIPGGHWAHLSNPIHAEKIIVKKLDSLLSKNSMLRLHGEVL